MSATLSYTFTATTWQHDAPGGWYFVSLPKELSAEIRSTLQHEEQGWGRLKATATIGTVCWATAIWFDTKHQTYLLPLKADIRKKTSTGLGEDVSVRVEL